MAFHITCPSCQATFQVNSALAGKRGRCARCRAVVQIPAALQKCVVAPDPKAPEKPISSTALMQEILGAFHGQFEPVRATWTYRIGIILVTTAMLMLPVLYLALVAAIGWLLVWHATTNTELFHYVGSFWTVIFFYAGPLIAGTILLLFMIKPLFARAPPGGKRRVLNLGAEPLLFAFVARVAQAVNAPQPTRIEVDSAVNASASLGNEGFIFGRNLTLTIGLPLVACLNVQQLAGVLAHELGHFSQTAGMRLTDVIHSINGWFARVVFERDGWDDALATWCEEPGRLSLIFYAARLSIGITRGILWVFMILGHVISCFLLRQMEYDADRFAARLVGSVPYEELAREIPLLDVATNEALQTLLKGRRVGGPPDDFFSLIVAERDQLAEKFLRDLDRQFQRMKTRFFDTHPSYPKRLAAVRHERAEGIFHMNRPATILFSDYPKLARSVTRDLIGKLPQ
jgi:predicted Zn finger-like uncharacterized protein